MWGRPADVLSLPDGSPLVSDDLAGAIYRSAMADPIDRPLGADRVAPAPLRSPPSEREGRTPSESFLDTPGRTFPPSPFLILLVSSRRSWAEAIAASVDKDEAGPGSRARNCRCGRRRRRRRRGRGGRRRRRRCRACRGGQDGAGAEEIHADRRHQRNDAAVAEAEPERNIGQQRRIAAGAGSGDSRKHGAEALLRRARRCSAILPRRSARPPMAKRPTMLPTPIRPTRPTARASPMPRSRAAAETWAKGMNIAGAARMQAGGTPPMKRGPRSASFSAILPVAVSASRACPRPAQQQVAATSATRTPAASACSAWRQPSAAIDAVAISDRASQSTPIPA